MAPFRIRPVNCSTSRQYPRQGAAMKKPVQGAQGCLRAVQPLRHHRCWDRDPVDVLHLDHEIVPVRAGRHAVRAEEALLPRLLLFGERPVDVDASAAETTEKARYVVDPHDGAVAHDLVRARLVALAVLAIHGELFYTSTSTFVNVALQTDGRTTTSATTSQDGDFNHAARSRRRTRRSNDQPGRVRQPTFRNAPRGNSSACASCTSRFNRQHRASGELPED